MKVKIDLHDAIFAENGGNSMSIPVTVEIDELLEFSGIGDYEVDVRELLAEQGAIAVIWDTQMLLSHYPHLTEDQAWDILQGCSMNYSAEQGLTWDDVSELVWEKYPDASEAKQRLADRLRSLLSQIEALPVDERTKRAAYGEIAARIEAAEQAVQEVKP